MSLKRDFFEDGSQAFLDCKDITECPLAKGSSEREEWEDGWSETYRAFLANHPETRDGDEAAAW